jgi:hypothetical protein
LKNSISHSEPGEIFPTGLWGVAIENSWRFLYLFADNAGRYRVFVSGEALADEWLVLDRTKFLKTRQLRLKS